MTRTLLAALALAVASAPAHAARTAALSNVPAELVGMWCGDDDGKHYSLGDCKDSGYQLVIGAYGYEGYEHSCSFTSVRRWIDYREAATTKTMGAPAMTSTATCGGEGCTWRETMSMYLTKGTLIMRSRRYFAEECKG